MRDRVLAQALMYYEADLCGECGHPMSETANSIYDFLDPARCGACDAIIAARDALSKDPTKERPQALRFSAVKRVIAEATRRRMPGTKNRK